uniref:Eukaryotic cobalamin-binding protein n=1 Tax=Musca domestica TaxID=7370 RepID=T1PCK4_MUSDO
MSQDNGKSGGGLLLSSLLIVSLQLILLPHVADALNSGTAATPVELNLATSPTSNNSLANAVTTDTPASSASAAASATAVSLQTAQVDSAETSSEQPATTSSPTTTSAPVHEIIGSAGPDKSEQEAILKALAWLKKKRAADFGWGNDTHVVILAKELSGAQDPSDPDDHLQKIQELEDTLSVKEMEIEILSMLDRHHTLPKPLNLERLARYVLALGSLCKDPKHFHGHDLVATLQHHEPTQDIEFALTTLAACSSAAHVRKRQIRRLLDIASGVADQNVDTNAMVILALRCIVTDHRHRHLQHFVRRPARGLASLQDPRGSFGSLRSTALAMQALQDLENDPAGSWNRTAASRWILSRQGAEGGWTEEPLQDGQDPDIGVGLTADIILALGWKGLGAVRALQCDHVIRENSDTASENGEQKLALPYGLTGSSAEESDSKNVSYTYTLWVGTNVSQILTLNMVSPKNTSFFKAMTQAAEIDPRFAFEAREWPNGHYVHTLAGMKEEPRGYNYWLLYRLPEIPDKDNTPGNQLIAPVGVDELMVEDGEHYLYWYKKL